jgi:hypothetical protein
MRTERGSWSTQEPRIALPPAKEAEHHDAEPAREDV